MRLHLRWAWGRYAHGGGRGGWDLGRVLSKEVKGEAGEVGSTISITVSTHCGEGWRKEGDRGCAEQGSCAAVHAPSALPRAPSKAGAHRLCVQWGPQ